LYNYTPVTVNLLPYAGQSVLFRFRQGTDDSGDWLGWSIDDVLVTSVSQCQSPAVLRSHVTWQGRPAQPNALDQLPITLTLKLGTSEYNYSGVTDASGLYTVTLGNVPNGTYNWRVKGSKYLANWGTIMLNGAPTTNAECGLMMVGDANNDNAVNVADFSILKPTFGKSVGNPGYDDRADFTGDQAVNVTDFNLLKVNFGQGGSPPIIP
jgi:hypothetical protein